jgi:hypothetical protein
MTQIATTPSGATPSKETEPAIEDGDSFYDVATDTLPEVHELLVLLFWQYQLMYAPEFQASVRKRLAMIIGTRVTELLNHLYESFEWTSLGGGDVDIRWSTVYNLLVDQVMTSRDDDKIIEALARIDDRDCRTAMRLGIMLRVLEGIESSIAEKGEASLTAQTWRHADTALRMYLKRFSSENEWAVTS